MFLIAMSNLAGAVSGLVKDIYMIVAKCFDRLFAEKKKLTQRRSDQRRILETGIIDSPYSLFDTMAKNESMIKSVDNAKNLNSEDDESDNEMENGESSYNSSEDEGKSENENEEKELSKSRRKFEILVPFGFVYSIFMVYIAIGMLIFKAIESDWSYLVSFYFAIITVLTVGFGDYVPAKNYFFTAGEKSLTRRNLAIASIYIVLGIAILIISIDLIHDKMKSETAKIKRLKRFLLRVFRGKNHEPKRSRETQEPKTSERMYARDPRYHEGSRIDLAISSAAPTPPTKCSFVDVRPRGPNELGVNDERIRSATVTSDLAIRDLTY